MEWLIPWHPVRDLAQAQHGERGLQRELVESHPMFGLPAKALGYRRDCDDWLFAIEDGSGRVAVVHLTYVAPDRSPCPDARFYASIDCWIEQAMRLDHRQCTIDDGTQNAD